MRTTKTNTAPRSDVRPRRQQPPVQATQLKDRLQEVKREEILRVAGELFFSKGFSQTSMEEIATLLAIGKPQIYACFPSKTALLAAVCNRTTMLAANVAAEAASSQGTPPDRVALVVRQLTRRVIEGRMNLAVLFREVKHLPPEAIKELASNFHLFNRSFESLLHEGVESGDFVVEHPAVVTHAVSGMVTWIYSWFHPDGPLSSEEVTEDMVNLALRMVGVQVKVRNRPEGPTASPLPGAAQTRP